LARTTAAAVIIGNEVLTAKVKDANGAFLAERLYQRGIDLKWMAVVPDEVDAIVAALSHARTIASHVFTSGGIGPTHDDVTVRAVALALGRSVVRLPEVEALIKEHYGARATPEAMRLADAPEGAELLTQEGIWYHTLRCANVSLLPGVPLLFKLQLENVLTRLSGAPVALRCIYLSLGEPEIARVLDAVAHQRPQVAIGSYPQFDSSVGYKVKVTVEHLEPGTADAVVAELVEALPKGSVLRVE
jgi:molybdenum cofactor synthesis domain-containing protein